MPRYKQQFFRPKSGDLGHTYEFEAANDEAAVAFAGLWSDHAPMELWRGEAMLKRWDTPHLHSVKAPAARAVPKDSY